MKTQVEKGQLFRELHHREQAFIIPNPWDIGTARLLAVLGFEALASTSAGYAFSVGKPDGTIKCDEMIAHIADLASATDLPVSADLENCFSDDPKEAAETIRLAAAAGCVGGSIEDVTSRGGHVTTYDLELAAEKVRAAVEAARSLDFAFTLTARCENFIAGRPDIKDTIQRLQAYQEAGADVLYAPGLSTREDIAAVISSVDRPVNVVMGLSGVQLSRADLSAMGVKRISVGSALSRAVLDAFVRAGREMKEQGTFGFAEGIITYREVTEMLSS
jgi:2-methylisocitrate lyase-like PEP mutase family enzyme